MESMVPTGSSQRVSAAVVCAVMECHDEAFRLLDSLVWGSGFARFEEAYDRWRDLSDRWRTYQDSRGQARSDAAPGSCPVDERARDFAGDGAGAESAAEVGAARHLVELMRMGDEGKMRYLTDAGMAESELIRLVELAMSWRRDAGLGRMGELSRFAAQSELGAGWVLQGWIDAERRVRLAQLLEGEAVGELGLAVAHTVSGAAEVVLASYWFDLYGDDSEIILVPGDELD